MAVESESVVKEKKRSRVRNQVHRKILRSADKRVIFANQELSSNTKQEMVAAKPSYCNL